MCPTIFGVPEFDEGHTCVQNVLDDLPALNNALGNKQLSRPPQELCFSPLVQVALKKERGRVNTLT